MMTSIGKEERGEGKVGKCEKESREQNPTRGKCCVWLLNASWTGKKVFHIVKACVGGLERGGCNFVIQSFTSNLRSPSVHVKFLAQTTVDSLARATAKNKHKHRLCEVFHSSWGQDGKKFHFSRFYKKKFISFSFAQFSFVCRGVSTETNGNSWIFIFQIKNVSFIVCK